MAFKSDLEAMILAALERSESHGYELARIFRERSPKAAFKENQLYPKLHEMEAQNLISARWETVEGKPSRKVYRLSEAGHRALERKRFEWRSFVEQVNGWLTTPDKAVDHG